MGVTGWLTLPLGLLLRARLEAKAVGEEVEHEDRGTAEGSSRGEMGHHHPASWPLT